MTKRHYSRLIQTLTIVGLLGLAAGSVAWALGPMTSQWPMFRHDARHTATSQYHDPTPNGTPWSFASGGGLSSPVIASDGTIYIGGSGVLRAINANGTSKWSYSIGGGSTRSTPAIADDGTVYIGSTNGYLYAVTSSGGQKWAPRYIGAQEISSSPVIGSDGTIYIGDRDGYFRAINPSNGTVKWSRTSGGGHMGGACIGSDGTIYVGGGFNLYAINPANGNTKWTYVTGYTIQSAPAMSADGTQVYVGSCDGFLHAVNTTAGTMVWQVAVPLIPASTSSSPAVSPGGMIYIGSNGANAGAGALFAIDPMGQLVWEHDTAFDIRSSPAVSADGTIVIGVMDGYVYGFNPDGTLKWQFLSNASGSGIYGSPAIASNGSVVVQNIGGTLFGNITGTPPAANAPSGLVVAATGETTTHLTWVDNSSDEYGFHIQRRMGTIGDFVQVGATGAGVNSFDDAGLSSGQTYYYRVCAYQWAGDSQFTPAVGVLTPGLQAPTGLSADPVTGTRIDLTWTDVATEELGYKIERFQNQVGPFVQVARVGQNVQSYSDVSVNPGTNYYYRVRAYDATRNSSYSNEDWAVAPGFDYSNIVRGNTGRPQIALTFDAGTAAIRSGLLDILRDRQCYCNFYITGYVAQTQPALLQRIAAEGHLVGNHSYDHPAFTQITDDAMALQLGKTDEIIYGLTSHRTRQWWRAPYGNLDSHVLEVTGDLGYRSAFWTIDSGDVGGASSQAIINTMINGAQNGNVCLFHCTLANTEGAIPGVIDGLRGLGYELVSVPELVAPLQMTAPENAISPGWSFMSLPMEPANTSPMCVFRGVSIDGGLYKWTTDTQGLDVFDTMASDMFGQLSSDMGYWLYVTPGQTVKFNGYPVTTDRHIKLPQTLPNPYGVMTTIGYPFRTGQPLSNCRVYNPNAPDPKLRSLAEARDAGWVSSVLYAWDSFHQGQYMVGLEDDWLESTELEPWHGYWFTSYLNELELIIPAPTGP